MFTLTIIFQICISSRLNFKWCTFQVKKKVSNLIFCNRWRLREKKTFLMLSIGLIKNCSIIFSFSGFFLKTEGWFSKCTVSLSFRFLCNAMHMFAYVHRHFCLCLKSSDVWSGCRSIDGETDWMITIFDCFFLPFIFFFT